MYNKKNLFITGRSLVTKFSDTSLKNNTWSLLLWCTCPLKSSRDPRPLWEVPTYRPSEPLCNTTYHVRMTFWVFHRSGMLQVSDSLLSIDSAGGCSIPVKNCYLAVPLLKRYLKRTVEVPQEDSRGTSIPFSMPTQEALLIIAVGRTWLAATLRAYILYAHSRGIVDICCGTIHLSTASTQVHSLQHSRDNTVCWRPPHLVLIFTVFT